MYQHDVQIRVRYAETDQMGFAYYGNYPTYYEVARVEAFRAIGFCYKEMEDAGIGMPVRSLKVNYHGPAKYDELLTVRVSIPIKPRARITFHYEVTNPAGKLINTGETELVFMNMTNGRPVKPPSSLLDLLNDYYE